MTLQIEKFIRKPKPVDAVQVTRDNMVEVANWVGGLHIPAPGLAGETNKEDYVHVPVRSQRDDIPTKAFPGAWVVRENYNFYRIMDEKKFDNMYELQNKPKPAPSPKEMASKYPKPTQVSAQEVVPGTPADEISSLTTGTVPSETDQEKAEWAALEAEEAAKLNEKEENVDQNEMNGAETPSTDDVVADELADEIPAEIVPGDMIDHSQPESDPDGTVQLGVPVEEPIVEAPSLCGSCGSEVVDGVCSADITHDVNGQATPVDVSS